LPVVPAETYPFTHVLRIRYNECDPQNVVFNANYFTYFDITITELWREAYGGYQSMIEAGADLMVAEATARYLAPARFDDQLELGAGIARLGNTSMITRLRGRVDGREVVEGELRHVVIDPATQSKREIPDDLRAALEPYVLSPAASRK
jgi:acyl-CoA thioester hydrolase